MKERNRKSLVNFIINYKDGTKARVVWSVAQRDAMKRRKDYHLIESTLGCGYVQDVGDLSETPIPTEETPIKFDMSRRLIIQFDAFCSENGLHLNTKTGYRLAETYLRGLINGAQVGPDEIPYIWISLSCGRIDRLVEVEGKI